MWFVHQKRKKSTGFLKETRGFSRKVCLSQKAMEYQRERVSQLQGERCDPFQGSASSDPSGVWANHSFVAKHKSPLAGTGGEKGSGEAISGKRGQW